MRLSEQQLDCLAERVPDAPVSPEGGRPAMDKRQTLRGIFWVLDNGAKWKDLPRAYGGKSSVHKYFTLWVREGVFENLMRDAGRLVEERGGYKLYSCRSLRRSSKLSGKTRAASDRTAAALHDPAPAIASFTTTSKPSVNANRVTGSRGPGGTAAINRPGSSAASNGDSGNDASASRGLESEIVPPLLVTSTSYR